MEKTPGVPLLLLLTLIAAAPSALAEAPSAPAPPGQAQLPLPHGFGMTIYSQSQDYDLDQLEVGIPGFDPALTKDLAVTNRTRTAHLTLDYWALPFLDLSVLAGYIDGETDVELSKLNIGLPLQDLQVDYSGLVYGAAFTLAVGGNRWFSTLTVQYTDTSLDVSDSSVTAWVITPKVGYTFGSVGLFAGAEWQKPEEKHQGQYNVPPFGVVPYSVTLAAQNNWNYHAGLTTGLAKHWVLTLEGGFGDRTSGLLHVDYRW